MSGTAGCDREPEVLESSGSGSADAGLRAHAAACADCAEALMVAACLREAAAAAPDRPLPDPGAVYRRALLDARREETARALRPIAIVERIAWVAGAAAAGAWLAALAPSLLETGRRAGAFATSGLPASLSTSGMATVAALAVFPILLGLSVRSALRALR